MAEDRGDETLLAGLLGDDEIAAYFSPGAEIAQFAAFEAALAAAEAGEGMIPQAAAKAIAEASFEPDLAEIRSAAVRDGVPTIAFVRQLRAAVGSPHAEYVHFGATSQDLLDTGLVLRLKAVLERLEQRLRNLLGSLKLLSARFGDRALMGRTRMRNALPITAGARIGGWTLPLARHLDRLDEMRPRLLVLQFGGAVGTLDKFDAKGAAVAKRLAQALGLGLPVASWHTQRDNLAECASWLSLVSGTLGKFGQDVLLMAQDAVGEIVLEGGGGSSAMPHKDNPVRAEVLVALARHNATLLPAMHQALVSEQERSGSALTLEWLTLPQLAIGCGAALRTAIELAGSIRQMGD